MNPKLDISSPTCECNNTNAYIIETRQPLIPSVYSLPVTCSGAVCCSSALPAITHFPPHCASLPFLRTDAFPNLHSPHLYIFTSFIHLTYSPHLFSSLMLPTYAPHLFTHLFPSLTLLTRSPYFLHYFNLYVESTPLIPSVIS